MSQRWLPAEAVPRVRNGWTLFALSLLTVGVVAIHWLYRLQREHPRRAGLDPSARAWLVVWLFCLVALLGALVASRFGEWARWDAAAPVDQAWFVAAMGIAVLFHLWFGLGTFRLGQRLDSLLGESSGVRAGSIARVALVAGLMLQMAALIGPPLDAVGAVALPSTAARTLEVLGRLGSGALLAWAMVTHRQANRLARRVRL